jgi:membrane protease YdiL (CAAX protease family)
LWVPVLTIILAGSAAVWVFLDAGNRGLGSRDPLTNRALLWAMGVFVALPFALPLYLLRGRPPGSLARCPQCRRLTLAHRAYCLHCGSPRDFEPPPHTWGFGELVGMTVMFAITFPLLAGSVGALPTSGLLPLSAYVLVQNGSFVLLSLYVVQRRYRLPPGALGWRWVAWQRDLLLGLCIGAVAIGLSLLAEEAAVRGIGFFLGTDRASEIARSEHARDPLLTLLTRPLSPLELTWLFLLLLVVVPAGEETFFRGLLFGGLRARWRSHVAVWASALFFALVHQQVVHFFPVLVLGGVLGYLREHTGGLVAPIAVHALNNAVAILSAVLLHRPF